MSKIQVNEIVNHFDNGAPDCPKGLTVTGVSTFSGDVSIGGTLTYEDVTNIDSIGIITARDGLDTPTDLVLRTGGTEKLRITNSGITSVTGSIAVNGENYPTTGPLSNRNILINGAMIVAQRGTSSTVNGFGTVDRVRASYSGGTITQSQESLTSSDSIFPQFRKYYRITNTAPVANTTTNHRRILFRIEAQDIANSGWNYTDSNSYITLSMWVRSSVAQTYNWFLVSQDGSQQTYSWPVTLGANTWTKMTQSFPGNSNLSFDDNSNLGLMIDCGAFWGTNYTGPDAPLNEWGAYISSQRCRDFDTTWGNTTDATLDVTGAQLELGSKATPFEHESYAQVLQKCKRYYQRWEVASGSGYAMTFSGHYSSSTNGVFRVDFNPEMRGNPTSFEFSNIADFDIEPRDNPVTGTPTINDAVPQQANMNYSTTGGVTGESAWFTIDTTGGYIAFYAEI
jgi:hypothetical protein